MQSNKVASVQIYSSGVKDREHIVLFDPCAVRKVEKRFIRAERNELLGCNIVAVHCWLSVSASCLLRIVKRIVKITFIFCFIKVAF